MEFACDTQMCAECTSSNTHELEEDQSCRCVPALRGCRFSATYLHGEVGSGRGCELWQLFGCKVCSKSADAFCQPDNAGRALQILQQQTFYDFNNLSLGLGLLVPSLPSTPIVAARSMPILEEQVEQGMTHK